MGKTLRASVVVGMALFALGACSSSDGGLAPEPPPPPDLSNPVAVLPTADFSFEFQTAELAFVVKFSDTSSPGSAPITAWRWNFGDGISSALQSPLHEYAQPGIYEVSLTVTTVMGSDTKVDQMEIGCRGGECPLPIQERP